MDLEVYIESCEAILILLRPTVHLNNTRDT
jgi:hypothetical protein